jgi:hypothetical protein
MVVGRLPFRPLGHPGLPRTYAAAGAVRWGRMRRWDSTATATTSASSTVPKQETAIQDDDKSGHISAGENESILFFDSECTSYP